MLRIYFRRKTYQNNSKAIIALASKQIYFMLPIQIIRKQYDLFDFTISLISALWLCF